MAKSTWARTAKTFLIDEKGKIAKIFDKVDVAKARRRGAGGFRRKIILGTKLELQTSEYHPFNYASILFIGYRQQFALSRRGMH